MSDGVAFWEWDLRTNRVRWSRQLAAMVGMDGEQVGTFLQFSHLVHEEDRPELRRWLEIARTDELPDGVEFRLRRPDGTWRPLLAFTSRIRGADGTLRLVASVLDLTERRALEASLRQAQKLDALGQVAGGVAHDFNNLLTVILTGTQYLRAHPPTDATARMLVHDMHNAAETGAALVRQLLSFARPTVSEPTAVDPDALARHIATILERLAGAHVKVRMDVRGCAGHVWADPTQIEQVLINLVVNARDALGEDGGEIVVTIAADDDELIARARLPPGRYARVSVADTGPGIAPEIADRLFEPFFTTKEAGTGTGLGLAVVSSVARQWHGGVVVDSDPGAGATFHVLFPQLAA